MTWLRILSGVLNAGEWLLSVVWKLVGGLFDWLLADFRHLVITALGVAFAWVMFLTVPDLKADKASETARANREAMNAETWRVSAEDWESEFYAFVNEVSAQQFAAAEADRANAARVDAEFAALNERTVDEYEARLAASAAAAERLRQRLARAEAQPAAPRGSGGDAADQPQDYTARCQAFGAADCDGLLLRLPGIIAEAQDNTDKLVGLQRYVAGSTLIDFSGEPEGPVE